MKKKIKAIVVYSLLAVPVYANDGGAVDVSAPVGLAVFALLFLVFKPRGKK